MNYECTQERLPIAPWVRPHTWRMPGTQLLDDERWLDVDEAFSAQMAIRDALIDERFRDVHALLENGVEPAKECLREVLEALGENSSYNIHDELVVRPDGEEVSIDWGRPLKTLGRLVQEDFCVLQPSEDGHKLVGAILCFPASWTLSEKIGKPMVRIHEPVSEYDAAVAQRVQRLFDMVHPDRPMWRANAFAYDHAKLFTPKREADPPRKLVGEPRYIRSERQVIKKLPLTSAVVFSIHTYVVPIESLTANQTKDLELVFKKSGIT